MGRGQRGAYPPPLLGQVCQPSRSLLHPSNDHGLYWGSGQGCWFSRFRSQCQTNFPLTGFITLGRSLNEAVFAPVRWEEQGCQSW